jgi:hypothetical protein
MGATTAPGLVTSTVKLFCAKIFEATVLQINPAKKTDQKYFEYLMFFFNGFMVQFIYHNSIKYIKKKDDFRGVSKAEINYPSRGFSNSKSNLQV